MGTFVEMIHPCSKIFSLLKPISEVTYMYSTYEQIKIISKRTSTSKLVNDLMDKQWNQLIASARNKP